MYDNAPAIPRLGIPAYVWLNDDVHGVQGPHGVVFPDGCGLGASFDRALLHAVGLALGSEARAAHNGYVHDGDRGADGRCFLQGWPKSHGVVQCSTDHENPYLAAAWTWPTIWFNPVRFVLLQRVRRGPWGEWRRYDNVRPEHQSSQRPEVGAVDGDLW